jgi:antitoxin component YwqK of YwqJK toxin-antitoxin module
MVQKVLLHNKIFVPLLLSLLVISCNPKKTGKEEVVMTSSFNVDTTAIPNDTVFTASKELVLNNGIYYLKGKAFSGHLKETYENSAIKLVYSYLNGMQHGKSISYYSNGQLRDCRMYAANKSFGKHDGFWENGNMKFEYYYLNDKREGSNKQWYQSGKPYAFLNFKDDKENGMQQAWRENGKPYINYEAKDGFRYGLQKSSLCYTLENEKFKPTSP